MFQSRTERRKNNVLVKVKDEKKHRKKRGTWPQNNLALVKNKKRFLSVKGDHSQKRWWQEDNFESKDRQMNIVDNLGGGPKELKIKWP